MKRLLYLYALGLGLTASAQSFPLRNISDEYVVTNLDVTGIPKKEWHEIIRDENGLYWFQSLTDLYSFDGTNWKTYIIKSANGENAFIRFNDLEVSDDNTVWVATEGSVYIFDRASENFIPIKKVFPGLKVFPRQIGCLYESLNTIILRPSAKEGLFLVDWKTKDAKYIRIDSTEKVTIPRDGTPVETDASGNVWGITLEKKGIWQYNIATGKIKCSWKGELLQFTDKRAQNIRGIAYDENENVLWLSYPRMIEKMFLADGRSRFYSFSPDMKVYPDSNSKGKLPVSFVRIDRDNTKWVYAGKNLVKLNSDISGMEYICDEPNTVSIGNREWFKPVTSVGKTRAQEKNILLWVFGDQKLSIIKKRNQFVKQIPYDTLSKDRVRPEDYVNTNRRKSIFFEQGRNGNYFLLQKNQGRPKLICFNEKLQLSKVLFNDQWKQNPAYFSSVFNPDVFYIAMMTPRIEPLDFRNAVVKDFKVDLNTFRIEEINLDFRQRIWRYGRADMKNTYWLFSNGYLFSYDPSKDLLDSIFICKPAEKGPYIIDGDGPVKGFDYPSVLHRNSSTFWICFTPTREIYKINLKKRKIDKIFKCCIEEDDCDIPGFAFGVSDFDSSNISIRTSFSSMLLNVNNNSITKFSDLFQDLPTEQQNGSGWYKDWLYVIRESGMYFLNKNSGEKKRVTLNDDYTWAPTPLSSGPLVNDRSEMILMSNAKKGFLVFNIDSVAAVEQPGIVKFSYIKLDNRDLLMDSLLKAGLSLAYNKYRNIHFGFSDYTVHGQDKIFYEYTLYKGGDTVWNQIEGKSELLLSELSPGKYQFLLRAGNGNSNYSEQITALPISIIPPFTQTIWFILVLIAAVAAILYGLYRYRLHQLKKLQIIRNNIASDLHDDIGSTLNSISIYSEVAKQQAGKEIPALELIGVNSRKIIESMSDIVWAINPENDSFEKIIGRMRSFAYQLFKAKKVEYTFDVDEKLNSVTLPMQVRKNFYLVFKEAITNLIKYSGANRVSISLIEENKIILLRIRDNGIGIPVNPQTQGNGLMNMKRRAEEIHAQLNIHSANGEGTGIELMLKV